MDQSDYDVSILKSCKRLLLESLEKHLLRWALRGVSHWNAYCCSVRKFILRRLSVDVHNVSADSPDLC